METNVTKETKTTNETKETKGTAAPQWPGNRPPWFNAKRVRYPQNMGQPVPSFTRMVRNEDNTTWRCIKCNAEFSEYTEEKYLYCPGCGCRIRTMPNRTQNNANKL